MRTFLARTGLLLLSASASLGVGCASERDPIDRTQPNALPKEFFVGKLEDPNDDPEFRTKSFVIGSAVSQSQYTIGEFSAVDRIRWEITENMLLARRAYQEAPGADNRGVPTSQVKDSDDPNVKKTATGTIVAAFKIARHFDIRRSYNAQTGEESNVIEENDVDRPWHQREYMRVDWSKNLVDSTNDSTRFFKSAKVTPVEYNVTNPDDEDALKFEKDAGYLDVTNKFTVEDDEIQFSWGGLKRCMLTAFMTGSSSYDCNPTETTVRTSFARVNPEDDFESFEDNYAWSDIVGNTGGEGDGFNPWLGPARTTWNPQYGFTDAQTHRYKSIHNIWKKSLQTASCGSNEDLDHDGTADECANDVTGYAGHKGAQCSTLAKRCTIPVRDREIKTIAYTLNTETPDAFQDHVEGGHVASQGVMEEMGASWNQMIAIATAYRREVECRRTGDGSREDCHAEFFESDSTPNGKVMLPSSGFLTDKVRPLAVDKGKPSFYVCHNPARDYDPEEACGKPGYKARLGDIRRNHLIYWPYESRARYGGVGWNPPDPITGETWGATATIMGRSATRAAAHERDIIQLALGDTKIEDIMAGVPAETYARTLREGTSAPEGFRVAKTPAELAALPANIDRNHLWGSIATRPAQNTTQIQAMLDLSVAKAKSQVAGTQFTTGVTQFDVLAKRVEGAVPAAADLASPLRGLEPAKLEAVRSWFEEDMAARGACFHDAAANAGTGTLYLASLAGWFGKKYAGLSPKERGEKIYEDLVRDTIKGIGLHEIGHSIGLRHNFASSWDAPNFNPQYWQLRTNEGKSTAACDGPRASEDDTCMGPRYLDPMTKDEQGLAAESRPGIDYFANTSTMEYQIERGGESVGLGTYDLHAMKALYGRVLETFDDKVIPTANQTDFAFKNFTQLQERDLIINGNALGTHYTTSARLMKVFDPKRDCRPATEEEKAVAGFRIVHGKVCAPPPKDHASWDDFASDEVPRIGAAAVKWHAKTDKDRVRWNYRWGEQYGAGGYMHTTMMDSGADIYELTQNLTRSFDLKYPWSYFRRGDREWTDIYLPQAIASSYFGRLRAYHWQVALDISRSNEAGLKSDDDSRPYVMAQNDIFSFMQNAVLMPEPGDYGISTKYTSGRDIYDLVGSSNNLGGPAFTLQIGDGRYISTDFENEKGGSWDYQKYVHHAGYETEKALAMMQLVDPRPTLFTVARENYLDGRDVMISFRSDLPEGVDRLLGGVLSEDWEAISPYISGESTTIRRFEVGQKSLSRPTDARLVFPNIGYRQQLSMAVYGSLFSRLSSDMTLSNKMRLWREGDDGPVVAGTRPVRFTDPTSGYTFIASAYGTEVVDGKSTDRGIASRMVERANALLVKAYQVKPGPNGKPLLDANGQPTLVVDLDGRPVSNNDPSADLELRRYVGLLDGLRQIGRALDGPLGGGGGEE